MTDHKQGICYEIEELLEVRRVQTTLQFHVKWHNYSPAHNSWISLSNLPNSRQVSWWMSHNLTNPFILFEPQPKTTKLTRRINNLLGHVVEIQNMHSPSLSPFHARVQAEEDGMVIIG